jgi:hypothetical protein
LIADHLFVHAESVFSVRWTCVWSRRLFLGPRGDKNKKTFRHRSKAQIDPFAFALHSPACFFAMTLPIKQAKKASQTMMGPQQPPENGHRCASAVSAASAASAKRTSNA